jgi:2-polyprenyl-6-methoxyphenol hydroxylase-like FAD-dependent oxidoreductase
VVVASIALEDGVVLAKCLRDVTGIENALRTFERLRRRVERIVAQGARSSSSSSKTAGRVARILRDGMLPLVFRYVVTEKSLAWM